MNTLTISAEISDELVEDLLATAFEGGINYWCEEARPKNKEWHGAEYASEVLTHGGVLELVDIETEEVYELDMDKLLKGFSKALGHNLAWFKLNDGKLVAEDYDADFADLVIQYALFDRIVFG